MHLISVVLGLVIAWVILFFIGPRKRAVSYYVQAPVVGLPISEIDSAMEAVGLASSDWKGKAEAPSPAPAPAPVPEPSVADLAINEQSTATPADQDTYSTPQAFSPAPGPSPALQ
jgi:hypothetical protein